MRRNQEEVISRRLMLSDFVYVITAAGAWLAAQGVKIVISLRQDGLSWQDLVTSGGMPSAHVALVTSMAVVIAMSEGPASPIFGVILTLWGVVVYDAVGVRRATGENTQIIRRIADKLKLGDQADGFASGLGTFSLSGICRRGFRPRLGLADILAARLAPAGLYIRTNHASSPPSSLPSAFEKQSACRSD